MLELSSLTKHYGTVVALDDVSLTVTGGRMHGFVGRNGAGKTTTMRIALGLAQPDAGQVRWKGVEPSADDRRRFGYLPEERGLYPKMTGLDQVAFFGRMSGMTPRDAIAGARRTLESLGLAERATEPVEKLSLGNQQRVQLAVALVASPELLVLDEPFSGLDPVGVDVLADVLKAEVGRGAAVLFSSHQLELVERLCDEVTIIDTGRIVAAGAIRALRQQNAAPRVRVALEGGWTAWAENLPGARLVGMDGDHVVLELSPMADDQEVLDAARRAGRVRTFQRELPTLSELFREVVAK